MGVIIYAAALEADGKILVGGDFTGVGGATRQHVARLSNTDAAIQSLVVSSGGTVITWTRSGAGPEVARVTFEQSADGVAYTSLGDSSRVANGWQLTGQTLPTLQNVFIRTRGYYATGDVDGSGSITSSSRTPIPRPRTASAMIRSPPIRP